MSDSDGVSKQAVHSGWMAHWMSTSFKSTNPGCSRLSICYESQEDNHDPNKHHLLSGPEKLKGNSKYEEGLRGKSESKRVKIMDENPIARSDKLRSERSNYQPFPMFNLQRKGENVLARKNEQPSSSHGGKLRSQTDDYSGYPLVSLGGSEKNLRPMLQWVPDAETASRENLLQPECTSEYPEQVVNTEKKSLPISKSIQGDFMGSTSKIIPYGFDFGKTPARSIRKGEEINQSNSILESEEQGTNTGYHSNSVLLVDEKSISSFFGKSRNLSRQNDMALLPHDPSTSRSQNPEFFAKQCHWIQDHTGIRLFPSENKSIELTKSKELYRGCISLPSLPCSIHDTEAPRTCTTVDSMEESSRGPKKLSRNHNFLFTETTDFNLTKGGQLLKESMVSTKLKGKNSPDLICPDQDDGFPIKTGVKLQLLGSSTCSKEEKDAKEFKTSSVKLKNESSAETNTMDLDTLRRNHVSGVVSSSSNKYFEWEHQSPASQAALASAREIGGRLPKAKLPDINQEPPELAVSSSTDTGTSRTQSLDADHLLSNAEQPTNFKSIECPMVCLELESSSRWVKRLKSSPTSAHATKSSKMEEAFSHEKVNNVFSKIKKCSITSSEPITGRSHGTEQAALNQRPSLGNGKSSSLQSVKENRDATLSHPWIRRWCHNEVPSSLKMSKAVEEKPSLNAISTCLNLLIEANRVDLARQFLMHTKKKLNLNPNACIFNILVKHHCRKGDLESAFEVVKEMKKAEISYPNLITYSTLINGLCESGRLKEAIELFEEMISKEQILPDALTYNVLINGFCRKGNVDRARKIMEFMKSNGCDPNVFNYSALISGFSKVERFEEAEEIFYEMNNSGLKPDKVTYTAMINCFCRVGRTDNAMELLKEMKEKYCRPDVVTFNVILGGLCREGKFEDALEMLERLPYEGIHLNKGSYRIVLNFLCQMNDLKRAKGLLDLMLGRGFLPHFATSNELLFRLCNAGMAEDAAMALFGLVEMGFTPEPDSWALLVELVSRERKLLSAFQLLDELI